MRGAASRSCTLPEKYLDRSILRDVEAKGYEDLWRILGTSEGTIKSPHQPSARVFAREDDSLSLRNTMRNMNCRNIRREIEEAGSAGFLSAAALSHLESCTACQTLSRQQTNLQTILSSLGTVEAPGDFDFRLRARPPAKSVWARCPCRLGICRWGFALPLSLRSCCCLARLSYS